MTTRDTTYGGMSNLEAGQLRKLSSLAQSALDIVMLAQRRGRMDMTLTEILHAVRKQPGHESAEKPSLSRELTHLSNDGLLLRRLTKRKSAWEALPKGAKQESWPASYAYYAPGARSAVPTVPATSVVPAASTDFY